jgi:ChpA-C
MKTWVRHSLNVGALTAGALLASGTAAHAQPNMLSTDNVGIGNGTQVFAPIQAPVNVCGNAVAVAGFAAAGCEGGSAASLDPEWGFRHFQMVSSDNVGVLNGTQVFAPIQAPVNVCGNAVAVAGSAVAGCEGGADADSGTDKPKHRPQHKPDYKPDHEGSYQPGYEVAAQASEVVASSTGTATMLTSGNLGVLNGTQAAVPIQIPINICGNSLAVLGVGTAACEGGATAD